MGKNSWDRKNLREISITDTAFLSATKAAQKGLPLFVDLLNNKQINHFKFYIKSKFGNGKSYEHMWSIPDTFFNGNFRAVVDNVPDKLKSIKYKDKIKVNANDVEDWIISDGDSTILGNFISHSLKNK